MKSVIMIFFVIQTLFVQSSSAIPIANGIEGDPIIDCGPSSISVSFQTENSFEGHLFVKGRYAEDNCKQSFGGASTDVSMEIGFEDCGMRRSRSANPRGVFVSITVILSFHPLFITKIDKALRLQCFYMEADKTVDTSLEVSMLTTDAFTQNVPMPVCRYEIRSNDGNGELITFAEVGQKVYHKWTCDTETIDTFCMLVHSCYVDDDQDSDRRIELLDGDGCANDKFVLGNLEYTADLMAGREVHVYKFPDRADLFFDCQIKITVKDPGTACEDVRPNCVEPVRGKREARYDTTDLCAGNTCVDVQAELQTIDQLTRIDGGVLGGLIVCCAMLSVSIIYAIYGRSKRPIILVAYDPTKPHPPPPPSKVY